MIPWYSTKLSSRTRRRSASFTTPGSGNALPPYTISDVIAGSLARYLASTAPRKEANSNGPSDCSKTPTGY